MDKFLGKYDLPKLNWMHWIQYKFNDNNEQWNCSYHKKKKNLPTKESPVPDGCTEKKNWYQHSSNYFTSEKGQNKLPKPFYKASISFITKFDQDKRKW